MHSFVRRLTLAVVALPLLLGGCAEDEPDTSPPDPTTTPPSVSEPVEPTLPPEAEGTGPEAAEAFVRHYFAAMDHARSTQDTTALDALALDSCRSCAGVVSVIRQVKSNGGTITGGDQTVHELRLKQEGVADATFSGRITLGSTAQVIQGSGDPDVDGTYPAGELRMRIRVTNTDRGWRFVTWSVVSA